MQSSVPLTGKCLSLLQTSISQLPVNSIVTLLALLSLLDLKSQDQAGCKKKLAGLCLFVAVDKSGASRSPARRRWGRARRRWRFIAPAGAETTSSRIKRLRDISRLQDAVPDHN